MHAQTPYFLLFQGIDKIMILTDSQSREEMQPDNQTSKEQRRFVDKLLPIVVIALIVVALICAILVLWPVVIAFFVLLTLHLTLSLGSRIRDTWDGKKILEFGGLRSFSLVGSLMIFGLMMYATIYQYPPNADKVLWPVFVMSLFMILTWPLFITAYFEWYVIGSDGIDKHSPWSIDFFLSWDEIHTIDFSASSAWFIVRGDKGKIHLDSYLNGLHFFAHYVKTYVPQEKWIGAKEEIERLDSIFQAHL